jgi:trehalose 6-phosphate phosphatase
VISLRSPLLVASDYDGVLSPIVPDPAAAVPDAAALQALVELGRMPHTNSVAVSGRSLSALQKLTGAPDGVMLVGTHGAEEGGVEVDGSLATKVGELHAALEELARQYPGALVELKPVGAAFHYRHVVRASAAARDARTVAAAAGARTISGKMVVECLFSEADKGTAITRLRERFAAEAVLFMGDDTTDEDVFAVLRADDVGVKVGSGETAARFRVASQLDVASVLQFLLATRRAGRH